MESVISNGRIVTAGIDRPLEDVLAIATVRGGIRLDFYDGSDATIDADIVSLFDLIDACPWAPYAIC